MAWLLWFFLPFLGLLTLDLMLQAYALARWRAFGQLYIINDEEGLHMGIRQRVKA